MSEQDITGPDARQRSPTSATRSPPRPIEPPCIHPGVSRYRCAAGVQTIGGVHGDQPRSCAVHAAGRGIAGLRPDPGRGLRPRAQRAGLLRGTRRAEPVLGHRWHLSGRLPDDAGWRRPLRCPAEHRAQPPAGDRRDRQRERREQQGDPPGPHPPSRGPCRRFFDLRQGRRADRARGDPAAPAARRRPGPTRTGGDLQRSPDPGDRRRADRARVARRQPHARQQRHPLSRARRADDGRHRERGVGAGVCRQPVRRHPGLPGDAGRRR